MIRGNIDWKAIPPERAIRTSQGERTVPHRQIIDSMIEAAQRGGFSVTEQTAWTSPRYKDLLSVTELKLKGGLSPDNMKLAVGVKSSQTRSDSGLWWYHGFSAAGGGGVVMNKKGSKKHVRGPELETWCDRCVDILAIKRERYFKELSWLRKKQLSEDELLSHLITRVRRKHERKRDRVSWGRIGLVDELFHRTGGRTALDLLLCFSAVAKPNGTDQGINRLDQIYTFYLPFGDRIREQLGE